MCNKEALIGYLYGELSASERAAFEQHAAGCDECRSEISGLQHTREHLAAWAPPEPEFNFQVIRSARTQAAPAPPRARRFAFVPEWALAAAAALLVAAGAAAIANVEVRYGADGSIAVRTGWSEPVPAPVPAATQAAPQAASAATPSEDLTAVIAVLEARLRQLETARTPELTRVAAPAPGITPAELRKILTQSETRQREEMKAQVGQIWRDFNAARAADFARVQQTLTQVQGLTNYQLRQQRDSIESLYLRTVSQQR